MNSKLKLSFLNCRKIILYLFGMIPFISCIMAIYWLFHLDDRDTSYKFSLKLTNAIYYSAFFTVFIVLTLGLERFFWFLPDTWNVSNEAGDLTTTRWVFVINWALFASLFIVGLFMSYIDKVRELKALKNKMKEMDNNF